MQMSPEPIDVTALIVQLVIIDNDSIPVKSEFLY